jgi:hypothetical protein
MPRLICLAQAIKRKKSKGDAPPERKTRGTQDPQRLYGILERVPLRLEVHTPIWDALREQSTHQLVIDEAHPEEAFPADVIAVERLADGALDQVERALADRRQLILEDAKKIDKGLLAKDWDRVFDREKEWLAIRSLLASAVPRSAKPKKNRALLLIKA